MALDTYSGLKASIADHLDRDDLTDQIDDFIDLAEAVHKTDIRIREMITRSSLTVDARYVDLPTGYLQGVNIRLLTDPVTVLNEINPFEMTRYRIEGTGKPSRYTIHENIEFDKTPDSSYSGEITYFKSFTPLDDDNTSNVLLIKSPGVYLYGALVASAPFLLNDERINTWANLYTSIRDSLLLADRNSRHSGPLFSRVSGYTP